MKQYITIISLAMLAAASFFLLRDLEKSLKYIETDKEIKEIATAHQVEGLYFGADNQLKYEIRSNTVHEFSHRAGTQIEDPIVRVFDATKQLNWHGYSRKALLSADKNTLMLQGEVNIAKFDNDNDNDNDNDSIRIIGSDMTYYADRREVLGNSPVRIETKNLKQKSSRFRLDIAKEIVYLNGGIKSYYSFDKNHPNSEHIIQEKSK